MLPSTRDFVADDESRLRCAGLGWGCCGAEARLSEHLVDGLDRLS